MGDSIKRALVEDATEAGADCLQVDLLWPGAPKPEDSVQVRYLVCACRSQVECQTTRLHNRRGSPRV
jgi:hypothetical protein